MEELKVPIFESYLKIQEEARSEAIYLNSVIAPHIDENIVINLGILIDASENPSSYGLRDNRKDPIKPRKINNAKFLSYDGAVFFAPAAFEAWYHTVHPDGVKRRAFFKSLSEKDKMNLIFYKDKD